MISFLKRNVDQSNGQRFIFKSIFVCLLVVIGSSIAASPAQANSKYAGFVIDAKTGKTLYASGADARRYPASLTKMMTLYMVFEALDSKKISKKTRIPVSRNAAAEQPSKLGLKRGSSISVEQAIYALVTKSANDAATAVGEFLGGSESGFAKKMTAKARSLGMKSTTFRNAHGLPNSSQVTTARDMAKLGLALREHFPHHYKYFKTRKFKYSGRTYGNHNRLLGNVRGVDGIKTGYTRASGFNLVSSVQHNGRSIVAVVMGGRTGASRDAQMRKLIARYLPKASKRGRGRLIARGPASTVVAALKLPKIGPVPQFREPAGVRVALAYAAPAVKASAFPIPVNKPVVGRQALIQTLETQKELAVVPTPAPQSDIPAPNPPVDLVTTASTQNPPSGWVVQIGAVPSNAAAIDMLKTAQGKVGSALSSASPFTVAYLKGNEKLYRARFHGFSGKSSAWAACKALERKGYSCWATQQ